MSRRRTTVYLGLGSNLGDREQNIRRAIQLLAEKVAIDRVSSLYESAPVGYADQPDFLNAACRGRTALLPEDLLGFNKQIEASLGRVASFPNGPRLIDIDILLFDSEAVETPQVVIPHPRMADRAFVLEPMAEIAPRARHPVLGKNMKDLRSALPPGQARRVGPLAIPAPASRRPARGSAQWIELTTAVDPELVEPLMELFTRRGKARVALEEQPPDEAWGAESSPATGAPVRLRAYLPATPSGQRSKQRIEVGLKLLALITEMPPVQERLVDQGEWETALRAHFPLLRIGQRLVLRPQWEDYQPGAGEAVVVLDPGAAFGTGHHPTTRLCLEALERWIKPGSRVLDVGTGSGVLAVAAATLGAARVLAVEIDPLAVRVARRNVRLNRLQRRIRVAQGALDANTAGTFELVMANITVRIICQMLPELRNRLAPGGALIVSGILAEQRPDLAAGLHAAGLRVLEEREHAGWLALVLGE